MPHERFVGRELSLGRILSAAVRRISDVPDALAWHLPSPNTRKKRGQIDRFANKYAGRRCFIIANGPSLSAMDLSPLAGEITFGLNRIYLLFGRLPFQPTFYLCVNELVLDQFSHEIRSLSMPKFLNWNRRRLFGWSDDLTHYVRLSLGLRDVFIRDFNSPLSSGGTVTYIAIQLAYFMGFSEVILVGLDHSFVDKGIPNKVETRQSETDANHFHPDYFPKGSKWQLPDLRRSDIAYGLARAAFEKDGRRIIDATVDGKCLIFDKADFRSLF